MKTELYNVFTYGSLMNQRVFTSLIKPEKVRSAANLSDFKRTKIKGAEYPAIRPSLGDMVNGLVWFDLTFDELAILDEFENSEYERKLVDVELENGGYVEAYAYIFRSEYSGYLSSEPWSLDEFEEQNLLAFMTRHNMLTD